MGWDGGGWGKPGTGSGGSSVQGVGDIQTGANAYWGLRGYSNTYSNSANPRAIDIVDQNGGNRFTVKVLTNGDLDVTGVNTWVTAHSVSTIYIAKWWDQTGNGYDLSSYNTTINSMATLTLNGIGTLPIATFDGNRGYLIGFQSTLTSPVTCAWVAKRTGNFTGINFVLGSADNGWASGWKDAADTGWMDWSTTIANSTLTDNAWHAVSDMFNGASSLHSDNGSHVSQSTGTTDYGTYRMYSISYANTFKLTGTFTEGAVWPGSMTSTQIDNLTTKMKQYWGF